MEKFTKTMRGYDPEEVNDFFDKVIKKVEQMNNEIKDLKQKNVVLEEDKKKIADRLSHYNNIEETLNKAIFMAQQTSDQMKSNALRESNLIVDEAKKNASRIVNEALLSAEKIENENFRLKRNVNIFKRKLKEIVESQMDIIDDIEKIEI